MAEHCTYHVRDTRECLLPATHRVVRFWREPTWTVEEAGQESAYADQKVRTTGLRSDNDGTRLRIGYQVPEFCAAHAAVVCTQRNRAPADPTPGGASARTPRREKRRIA